jgi:DNA-binding response OmpR family regulator
MQVVSTHDRPMPRVILLDDDPHVLKAVARLLRTMGMDVVPVPSCAAARDAAGRDPRPDLIVADRHLPDGDGAACAVDLKGLYGCATLVLSAHPAPDQTPAGIDRWIMKPPEPLMLQEAVRALLARGADDASR